MDRSKFDDKKEWRKFAVGLAVLLAAVATIQVLKGHRTYPCFYGAGAAVLLAGLAAPALVRPLYVLFAYLGEGLGWISTRVILFAVFYLAVTPIGTVLRLFGKRFMPMRPDPKCPTYWIDRNKTYGDKESFENQF
jgi:hypothetical protein